MEILELATGPEGHSAMTGLHSVTSSDVIIPPHALAGTLSLPKNPHGWIVFAHGSGSSHLSPRRLRSFARELRREISLA